MRRDAQIAARRAYVSPVDVRRQWRGLIDAGADVAARIGGAAPANPRAAARGTLAERLADFSHLLRGGSAPAFPAPGVAPAMVAEAFFKLARAVLIAEGERRTICAGALAACALALDQILYAEACAASEGWKSRMGHED